MLLRHLRLSSLGNRALQSFNRASQPFMAPKRQAKGGGGAAAKRAKASAAEEVPPSAAAAPAENQTKDAPAAMEQPAPSQRSFFLMKSEADVFSIDDLAGKPNQTEPWDGVRNHQAKKIMQAMRQGDQALFWASNQKAPGVVGIVEIAKEAYPDPTQFDTTSEYYDIKASEESPKWVCVDVKLVRKLERPITLAALKQKYASGAAALQGMQLFRMSRLSVQAVAAEEWSYVLGMEEEK